MFNSESKTSGREQVDVTGLIGQYAHGNEPSHHMAYLYNYVGKREKTKEKVQYILNNFYKNTPDGLIGNEDCGQMSAWYVLSSMGIYNVTPGEISWSATTSNFNKITVNFENKSTKSITRESEAIDLLYFDFDVDNENNKTFAVVGMSESDVEKIIPVPVIQAESKSFKNKLKIEIVSQNPDDEIYFGISDKDDYLAKKLPSILYTQPFEILQSSKITAYIQKNGKRSNAVSAQFFKKPNNYTIEIESTYNPQYHAGGTEGLIDGIFGTENWRKGDWQGYQSQNFEAVVDLQEIKEFNSIGTTFLQDSRSWILMPTKVEYYISTDNINFTLVATIENTIDPKITENKIQNFGLDKNLKAKYVKVKAYNFGKLPEWHQGFGGDAFIFVDEITIK